MDIYKRVENLENLVNQLIKAQNNNKYYTDADINGLRQNVGEIQTEIYPQWNGNAVSYFAGEKVDYESKHYKCIQNHTSQSDWTPDTAVSLWVEIADPAEEWPEWKQPTGAHDAYAKGAKVTHLFRHWTSDVDSNVWEPGVYGWTEA